MRVVIAGVTSGPGRALAEALIGAGHSVFGAGRSGPAVFELRMAYPEQHFAVVDVALEHKVALWATDVLGSYAVPDILIYCAEPRGGAAPIWEQSDAEFSARLDATLRGSASVLRHFLPPMLAARRGLVLSVEGEGDWPELWRVLAAELPAGLAAATLVPPAESAYASELDSMSLGAAEEAPRLAPELEAWAAALSGKSSH